MYSIRPHSSRAGLQRPLQINSSQDKEKYHQLQWRYDVEQRIGNSTNASQALSGVADTNFIFFHAFLQIQFVSILVLLE